MFKHIRSVVKSDYYHGHVCPSVVMEHLGSHWADLREMWYLNIFKKGQENPIFIKIWQKSRLIYVKTFVYL
jgi:hypothetical protein